MIPQYEGNEYIWAVSQDLGDGHKGFTHYFTDRDKAIAFAGKCNSGTRGEPASVVQTTLYCDQEGRWFRLVSEEVGVDIPAKAEVLAKLTREEKFALGIR